MGRMIRREVVGVRCDLRSCGNQFLLSPTPVESGDVASPEFYDAALSNGWVIVLTPQMRSYCPEHAFRAHECTCSTHPERSHLCIEHGEGVKDLLFGGRVESA